MSATRAVGRYGEDVAVRHLADAGWTVLARNWRHSEPEMRGELDIVAVDPAEDCLVAVEVKTRRSLRAGHPLEAVTDLKVRQVRRLLAAWCVQYEPAAARLRVDVLAVTVPAAGAAHVEHVRAVG